MYFHEIYPIIFFKINTMYLHVYTVESICIITYQIKGTMLTIYVKTLKAFDKFRVINNH
jgi:hypothetical protein